MKKDIYVAIGVNIIKHRNIASMTQTQVADVIGVSYQQVQKYEQGVNRIPLDKLLMLSKLFNCPIHWFFEDISGYLANNSINEIRSDASEQGKLISLIEASPKKVRKSTIQMLNTIAKKTI